MAGFRNIFNSLILLIAGSNQKELARQVSYLKVENQILRSKLPARLSLTEREKNRLCRFAKKAVKKIRVAAGRPRTRIDIEKLVLKLAKDNGWGYTRILGELRKLGIESITRNTVKNILRRGGFETGPRRGPGTWDEFLKRHAKTLWQCDFYSKKVLTPKGFKDLYLLVFLHVGTRRVCVLPSTYHPNEAWVVEQAEAFREFAKQAGLKASIVMRDRDTKFTACFDAVLKKGNRKVLKAGFRSPNQNAFVERFIQTLQQECLDHFFVFGQAHMDHLCDEFTTHYHDERPHQGLENSVPVETTAKARSKRTGESKADGSTPILRLSDIRTRWSRHGLSSLILTE